MKKQDALQNCIYFNKLNLTEKFDENVTNETITFQPMEFAPIVSIKSELATSSIYFYPVCGPLMRLLKEFAISRRAW